MTILLIDDDETGTLIRARVLRLQGFQVLCAHRGRDGIEQFTRGEIDLVILDFHLPDLNGDKVLVELKRLKPHVPVIVLAGILGIAEDSTPQADFTIVKGEGPQALLEAIGRLIRHSP